MRGDRPSDRSSEVDGLFRPTQGRKRTCPAGRGLRDDLRLYLQGRPAGRAVMALSHAPAQTPPPAPIETFARYHQGSRLHPPTAQEGRRQNREGGHWEGDLFICKRTRPVLVLHERESRVTLAARLAGKTGRRDHFRLCWQCSLGSNRRCASPSLSTMIPPSLSTPVASSP
jgi:hypothetical protein